MLVFWIFGLARFASQTGHFRIFDIVMFRISVSVLYGFPSIFSFGILKSEVGDGTAMEHLQTANRYDVYFMIVRTSISTLSLFLSGDCTHD